jgi:phospholipase/carboxylesterase
MKLIGLALFLFGIFIPKTNSIKIKNNVEPILHYIVREPIKKNNKPPLIILMHGLGSNEKDLFSFTNQLPDSFLVISVRAPYTIGKDSYAWYQLNFIDGKPISNKDQAE